MQFEPARDVRITLPRAALGAIFDECDRYDHDETGGRVLGTCKLDDGRLTVDVAGVIGPGPGARRSSTSFFQDGAYQERIFRNIEQAHPTIEHLGNWHTHHVNGFPELSGGDVETYRRTVAHKNHNLPFFYALLVVAKRRSTPSHRRYDVKHYILRRGDDAVYEVRSTAVHLTDASLVSAEDHTAATPPMDDLTQEAPPERVYDRDILANFFEHVRPYTSKALGVYWRGPIELVDRSCVQLVVLERAEGGHPTYSVTLRDPPDRLAAAGESLAEMEFHSARAALITTERVLNGELYGQLRRSLDRDSR